MPDLQPYDLDAIRKDASLGPEERATMLREAEDYNKRLVAGPVAPPRVKPLILRAAEFGISSAAQIGGEVLGGAGGATAGAVAGLPFSPAASVAGGVIGGTAGAVAGGAAGSVAGDIANRGLERATGYSDAPIVPSGEEMKTSAELGALGVGVARAAAPIARTIMGARAAETAVEGAQAERTAAIEAEKQVVTDAALKQQGKQAKQIGTIQENVAQEVDESSAALAKQLDAETNKRLEKGAIEQVGGEVGLGPEEAKAAAAQTFEERAAAGTQGREAVKGARTARIRETGELFSPIYDPIKANLVDSETLISTATESANGVNRVLAAKGIVTPAGRTAALGELSTDSRTYLNQLASIAQKNPETGEILVRKDAIKSIGELRTLNGNMMALAAKTNDPTERAILRAASQPVRDVLDAAVPEELQPTLTALKQQYAQINRELPFSLARKIDKATTLPEMGGIVFGGKPETAIELWRGSNPEQKGLMKRMFAADLMGNEAATAKDLGNALKGRGRIMRAMFGDDAWSRAQSWVNVEASRKSLEEVIKRSPQAEAEVERGVEQAVREASKNWERMPISTMRRKLTQDQVNQTAEEALRTHAKEGGVARYLGHRFMWGVTGGVAGAAMLGHFTPVLAEAAVLAPYLLRRKLWIAAMDNPAMAAAYRKAIMSPSARTTGYLLGRLATTAMVEGAKPEAARGAENASSAVGQ